jgi:Pyruvate/2-oxoacid:ferredoxin oxidoreductase delta subunit
VKPVVDAKRCPAVQTCPVIQACPRQAVSYVADEGARLGGRIVFDEAACDGCGACVGACCGAAIEMPR